MSEPQLIINSREENYRDTPIAGWKFLSLPLSQPTHSNVNDPLEGFINKYNTVLSIRNQYEQARKLAKNKGKVIGKKSQNMIFQLLPDYHSKEFKNSTVDESNVKGLEAISVKENAFNNAQCPEYYKRISTEMLDLIDPKKDFTKEAYPQVVLNDFPCSIIDDPRDKEYQPIILNDTFPELAKYVFQLMNSKSTMNTNYGIVFKSCHSQNIPIEASKNYSYALLIPTVIESLLNKMISKCSLLPREIDMFTCFLNTVRSLHPEDFDIYFRLLKMRGIAMWDAIDLLESGLLRLKPIYMDSKQGENFFNRLRFDVFNYDHDAKAEELRLKRLAKENAERLIKALEEADNWATNLFPTKTAKTGKGAKDFKDSKETKDKGESKERKVSNDKRELTDLKVTKESKDRKEPQDQKESIDRKGLKDGKDLIDRKVSKAQKESENERGSRESKDKKVTPEQKLLEDQKGSKDGKESKDLKASKSSKELKDQREGESEKESKDQKVSQDQKLSKDQKGSKGGKDSKDLKDSKSSKELQDQIEGESEKESKDQKVSKDQKLSKDRKSSKEGRDSKDLKTDFKLSEDQKITQDQKELINRKAFRSVRDSKYLAPVKKALKGSKYQEELDNENEQKDPIHQKASKVQKEFESEKATKDQEEFKDQIESKHQKKPKEPSQTDSQTTSRILQIKPSEKGQKTKTKAEKTEDKDLLTWPSNLGFTEQPPTLDGNKSEKPQQKLVPKVKKTQKEPESDSDAMSRLVQETMRIAKNKAKKESEENLPDLDDFGLKELRFGTGSIEKEFSLKLALALSAAKKYAERTLSLPETFSKEDLNKANKDLDDTQVRKSKLQSDGDLVMERYSIIGSGALGSGYYEPWEVEWPWPDLQEYIASIKSLYVKRTISPDFSFRRGIEYYLLEIENEPEEPAPMQIPERKTSRKTAPKSKAK